MSDWVVTEVSSALSLKVRTGALDLPRRAAALAALHKLLVESLVLIPVLPIHFRAAAQYLDRHDLGLRAADALHLAVASDRGATLVTLDRRLRAAGLALGVAVEPL